MGFLSNLTELLVSGFTWAINKIIDSGAWVMAAIIAVCTWITGTLVGAVTAAIQPLLDNLPPIAGNLSAFGIWLFGLFVLPALIPEYVGLGVRFIIRRIPVIG